MIYTNKRRSSITRWIPQSINEFLLDKDHRKLILKSGKKKNNFIPENPVFVFVLLQYNHFRVTEECINSIDKLSSGYIKKIVVVDNCSTDGSYDHIQVRYGDRSDVFVIKTEKNLGYAGGNNYGYKYAKKELSPDFVVMANNDVIFKEYKILKKINREYSATGFSILGPDIIVKEKSSRKHQNPHGYYFKTQKDVLSFIQKNEKMLENLQSNKIALYPPDVYGRKYKDYIKRNGALVLHGACYIFSPLFISDFNEPFDNRTFLYGEEAILCLKTYNRGHKLVYSPKITVLHNANSSTDKSDYYEFYTTRYKFNIESAHVYLDVLNELGRNNNNLERK